MAAESTEAPNILSKLGRTQISLDGRPPIACTLDAAALGNREDEFRVLFSRWLLGTHRTGKRSARIVLDVASELEASDLFAREKRCCAFFDFSLVANDETIVVDIGVPEDAEGALDYLLALAPPPRRR